MEAFDLAQRKALAERVASGSQLSTSPKLRSFFMYVVDCALRDHAEEATEHQIGVKIFGRKPGYSSGDDSIVRSQARLLRLKLTSHFMTEGAAEPLIIEMPKGRYLPVFREREVEAGDPIQPTPHPPDSTSAYLARPEHAETEQPPTVAAESPVLRPASMRPWWTRLLVIGLAFGVLLGLVLGAWADRRWSTSEARRRDPLWSPFLTKSRPTLVIYSNPLFHGTPFDGLHLVDPDSPPGSPANPSDHESDDETYTGTGEVAAVSQLTRFFYSHDATFVLKRSRLVTWDEARSSNLIFVGAPSQNSALHDLPALSELSIALDPNHHGYIVNQHAHPGEPSSFPKNDRTQETAIVALMPGLEASTHILIVSGLTTIGTQTAVEYLCRSENVSALAQQMGTTHGEIRPFEAILQIGISKGVGVNARIILLHHH